MAATDTLTNLQQYITAIQKDKKVVTTGRKESFLLKELMGKKRVCGGAEQQFSVRNGEQATNARFFKPDDSSSDIVGGSGSNNYTSLAPVVNGSYTWSFIATDLRYSDLQLQQAKTGGASQLAYYLETRLEFSEQEAAETIGDKIINGTGDGKDSTLATTNNYGPATSSALEPYGLRYQNNFWSDNSALGTALTNSTLGSNLHFGLPRHLHSELVGNVLDATAGYGTTVSLTGTFVADSTEVTIASTDLSQEIGWEIWIDWNSTGNYEPLGREFVVASQASGAQTVFNMSTIFRTSMGAAGAYPIEIRAPYNTTDHGAAGALTTTKMSKAYYQASDGMNQPNLASCNTRMFGAVQNFLVDALHWNLQTNDDLKLKGYADNFMYLGATFVADNHIPDGEIHFENTNFTEMVALEGRDDYKIKGSDIIQLPSQTGHEQYGCAKTMAFQVINKSPRSSAQIRGLTV